jgi:SAM-dependent methyltransferase
MSNETESLLTPGKSNEEIKTIVKEKYGAIARQSKTESQSSCCGSATSCCDTPDYLVIAEDYSKLKGYNPDADLGLGCGLPTEYAKIKPGDTVVDLGSGAGNDVFIARAVSGENGKVIGIDMTEEMIKKANENNAKHGYKNVEFRLGDIENLPVENNSTDVVISNCVLNLVPDKTKAFSEIHRILKTGGHFSVSDLVTTGDLPEAIRNAAEMYVGCIAGALKKQEYLEIIAKTGFTNVQVQKESEVSLPDDVISGYLGKDDIKKFRASGVKVLSVSVYAEKV